MYTSGLPLHKFNLKIGAPITLMKNLGVPKLCNGTRKCIVTKQKNMIEDSLFLTQPKIEQFLFHGYL